MLKGLIYAFAACALWGLVFAIPGMLKGFSPFEIAFGRCLLFGLFSSGLFFFHRKSIFEILTPEICWKSFQLAFIVNIVHYVALIFGLYHASETLTTMILGLNPIAIAFYGNWQRKEVNFQQLLMPCALMIIGLMILNLPLLSQVSSFEDHFFGIICAIIALGTWSWFIVENASFLKKHPFIPVHHWVTISGVSTLVCIIVSSIIVFAISIFNSNSLPRFSTSLNFYSFIYGCGVLGIGSSWMAHFFWNRATQHLPIVLAGQLSILETLFGLFYIFMLETRIPTFLESLGILIVSAGIMITLGNNFLNINTENVSKNKGLV